MQMPCRTSRIRHARAVFSRCRVRPRLVSSRRSERAASFPSHRYFVLFNSPFSRPSAFLTVLLQCLFDRFGSVFPQCGLMVFPGVVIVSR